MIRINGLNTEEVVNFNTIKVDCQEEEKANTLEIIDEGKNYISVYDYDSDKTTTFTDPSTINIDFLENKISISEDIKTEYGISENFIAQMLYNYMNPNHFITLEDIYIVSSEEELRKLDKHNAYEALRFSNQDFEELIGIMLYEENAVVLNVSNMERTAKKYCFDKSELKDEVKIGIETTLFHELRHLMLDTNFLLPEDIYPTKLSSEDMVEEFCRKTYEEKKHHEMKSYVLVEEVHAEIGLNSKYS